MNDISPHKWAWLWSLTALKFCVGCDAASSAGSSATAELCLLVFFDGDGLDYKLTSLYIRQIYVLLRYSLTGTKVL